MVIFVLLNPLDGKTNMKDVSITQIIAMCVKILMNTLFCMPVVCLISHIMKLHGRYTHMEKLD